MCKGKYYGKGTHIVGRVKEAEKYQRKRE